MVDQNREHEGGAREKRTSSDKLPAPPDGKLSGRSPEGDFRGKFENFWYYHKWHVIVGVATALVLGFLLFQSFTKTDPDATVLYAGQCYLPPDSVTEMERIFTTALEDDVNEDHKKSVQLRDIVLLSGDKQASALYKSREDAEDDEGGYVYAGNASENEDSFYEEISYGKSIICLIDEYYYNKVKNEGRLATFAELYGSAPEGALDECGIRIHDLPFGRYFALLRELPDDTVLCIKAPTVLQQKKKKPEGATAIRDIASDEYLAQVEMLERILTFKTEGAQ